jgi:hypothetical protein
MAYSIGYMPQRNEYREKRSKFPLLLLVFFLVFLLSVQIFSQEGASLLRRMFLPVGEETVEAFSEMVLSVEEGVPLKDAVTAFCREVIALGQLP